MSNKQDKLIVVGAGAIGSILAFKLASVYDVLLIGRKESSESIKGKGLAIQGIVRKHVGLNIAEKLPVIKQPTHIFLCTKAYDVEEVLQKIECEDPRELTIVCLQNGIGVESVVQSMMPESRVVKLVTYLAAEMKNPNTVKFVGDNVTWIARKEWELREILSQGGLKVETVEDISVKVWEKLIYNCVINGLGTILEVANSDLQSETLNVLKQAIVRECGEVAQAEGVLIDQDILSRINAFIKGSKNYNSTLVDLQRGRETEVEYLNGAIVRLGKKHGIATFANLLVRDLIRFKSEIKRGVAR